MTKQSRTLSIKQLVLIGGLFGLSIFITWWLSQRLVPTTILILIMAEPIGVKVASYLTEVLAFLIALVVWAQLFMKMKIKQPRHLSAILLSLSIGVVTLVMSVLHPPFEWQNIWRVVLYLIAGAVLMPWVIGCFEKLKNEKQTSFWVGGSIAVAIALFIAADYIHTYHKLLFGY